MKRLLFVLLSVALLSLISYGCVASARAFTEPDQEINVAKGEEFIIALGSNISTGYGWQVDYDNNILTLIEKTYKENDKTGKQLVGASGTEFFKFKSLNSGETEVTFTYRRPWEQPSSSDEIVFFEIKVK